MEFLEVLTEGLEKVLMVRGGGREVITIYSWTRTHHLDTPSRTPELRGLTCCLPARVAPRHELPRTPVCTLVAPRVSLELFTFIKLLCDSTTATCMRAYTATAIERLPGLTSTCNFYSFVNVSSTTIFCWIYCLEWCCFGVYSLLYRYLWCMYEYKDEPYTVG